MTLAEKLNVRIDQLWREEGLNDVEIIERTEAWKAYRAAIKDMRARFWPYGRWESLDSEWNRCYRNGESLQIPTV